jgi:DNA invertase Pin-like site-specific DNA recombinase
MSDNTALGSSKIHDTHRQRAAWIYVRQSSLYQVQHNLESQRRQYERVDQAMAYGWTREQIVVVDDDQAKTAALPNSRPGFARMVAAIAREEVGLVLSLEGARLARNGPDWSQLLFLCRWTSTLIGDEHGLYDLSNPSDRMLLGIRGEVNQLELDTSIQRMVAARWSKAKRGDFFTIPPAGYEVDDFGQLVCTPDEAVVEAIRTVFAKFDELGTARQVWLWFLEQKLPFPVRNPKRRSHPIDWRTSPRRANILEMLHHPIYAGAYAFGRRQTIKQLDPSNPGRLVVHHKLISDWNEWPVLIHDHHFAYISWERWVAIQEELLDNRAMKPDGPSSRGAAREGRALLQGLARCGHCGRAMYVNFGGGNKGATSRTPQYRCVGARHEGIGRDCQTVGGRRVDAFVADAFLEATAPASVQIVSELDALARHDDEASRRVWEAQLEKAEYEAQRAQRQYEAVEPENRLVARTLERTWNEKLQALETVRARSQQALRPAMPIGQDELAQLTELGGDVRAIWNADTTTNRDRKQLLRCLVEEVQLRTDSDVYTATIIWRGGATSERTMTRRQRPHSQTDTDINELVRRLAAELDDAQIARVLNKQGRRTGVGNPFNVSRVSSLRQRHSIPARPKLPPTDPLSGPFTADQAADELGVTSATIHRWVREGLLPGTQLAPYAPWQIRLTAEVRQRVTIGDAPSGWVGLTEAARRLGLSKQLVAHRVNTGQLPAKRTMIGKRTVWRIDVSSTTCDNQTDLFDQTADLNQHGA